MSFQPRNQDEIGWTTQERLEEQRRYWHERLAGAPALLHLPSDHFRSAEQQPAGDGAPVVLDEELTAGLRELSRGGGTTLFTTLLAGWAVLLRRLSGQEDVVIGTPIAIRGRSEIGEPVGYEANTLALRMDLSGGPTVEEVLTRIEACVLGAQEHQDLPFEEVAQWLQPVRDRSHRPMSQVMIVWHGKPEGPFASPQATVAFDLKLSLSQAGRRIVGAVDYASSLYERSTIERYAGYLQRVLRGMVENPRQSIEAIDLLSERERSQVLQEWNATEAPYPKDKCVHEVFEEQVERTPDAVAVVYEGESLTYWQLNGRANQLAHYLRAQGMSGGEYVPILMPRCLQLLIAQLAVLKNAAAYVPLDPSHPVERLVWLLRDSGARYVLTDDKGIERLESTIPSDCGEWLNVDRLRDQIERCVRSNPDIPRSATAPAYVMYTSGSTGTPKGVVVPHRAVSRLVINNGYADITASDCVAHCSNPAFDAATFEVWGALLTGARLCIVPQALVMEPRRLSERLAEEEVTVLWLTVGLFNQYSDPLADVFRRLRHLLVGGDVLDPHTVRRVLRQSPPQRLLNGYGPTECTTFSATHLIERLADEERSVPLGRPISNTRIYILDGHGALLPVGVPGEIYIGGAGVACGYLNQPRLTAERFVKDPFSTEPDARMYRTGDLGRWRADGCLEYLGRNDFQVKVRGFRVELGEIESRLCQCPGVREAVVLAREDNASDKRLVAYYTMSDAGAQEDSSAAALRLRGHLSSILPQYMVPAAYVRLSSLPLTANGKVNRKGLPVPEADAYAVREYEEPQGEIEQQLAQIWLEILKVGRVGRHDTFFSLGGNSLLATEVVGRIRNRLGWNVSLRDFYEHPMISGLAESVVADPDARSVDEADSCWGERSTTIPLAHAQRRVWFLCQLAPNTTAYNTQATITFEGPLDVAALEWSLNEIVRRHEIFRTSFEEVADEPVQVVHEFEPVALPVHDFAALSPETSELRVRELIETVARHRFSLETWPLIRWNLVRLGSNQHVLIQVEHHLVHDGYSLNLIFSELTRQYTRFVESGEPLGSTAPPQFQYADFAIWEHRWMSTPAAQRQLMYWTHKLADCPTTLPLPRKQLGTLNDGPDADGPDAITIRFDLPHELARSLRSFSAARGTTLYVSMLTAFVALLNRYSGESDIPVGTAIANRRHPHSKTIVGMFVNSVVLRCDASGDPTFDELLRRVREVVLEAAENQEFPFEKIVEVLKPRRLLGINPFFQSMFSFHDSNFSGTSLPETRMTVREALSTGEAKFDLSVIVIPGSESRRLIDTDADPEGICVCWEYSRERFGDALVESMRRHYLLALSAMVTNPRQRVGCMPLIDREERSQILVEWNATEAPYPRDECLHELFEHQVSRQPNAVAVVYEDEKLTYGELNTRANRLGHSLRGLGVGPEGLVALCLERSLDMVVGILAVLKAGGAYVPVDPEYPLDRVRYVLEDAAPKAVLTHAPVMEGLLGTVLRNLGEKVPLLDLSALAAPGSQQTPNNPERQSSGLHPDNLAYVIYTSGSTGLPKGVMIEHRGLVNHMVWQCTTFGFGAADVFLQRTSVSFDAAVWELWSAFCAGGCLCLLPGQAERDPAAIASTIQRHRVSIVQFTPSLLQAVLTARHECGQFCCRYIFSGGEPLSATLVDESRSSVSEGIVNLYGPTEATIDATAWRSSATATPERIPIGRPVWNTQIYILDGEGAPVPVGVTGEIYIGGAGVARGYLNRPELTAERFVKDPFSTMTGARMYRTGDLGRWRTDGQIEYLGRNDFQVKVRGFRIELGEIESRLRQCPGVREAVVVAREDSAGDKRLVAYYTRAPLDGMEAAQPQEDSGATPLRLRGHLAGVLPEYMVPAAYVRLDTLPLTTNGKLDRKALPVPATEAYAVRGYEEPQGEIERQVAQVWSEVLKVERVGRHANFFDLGGHSLLAVKVISRIRTRVGWEVGISSLFAHAELAEFARAVSAGSGVDAKAQGLPRIVAAPRTGDLELSYAQQRLWFLAQMPGVSQAYHISWAVRLEGDLNRGALRSALDRIVQRHETLRTRFEVVDGQAVQRIESAPHGFALLEQDLGEVALREVIAAEAQGAFDLSRGPLIRGRLIRHSPHEHTVLITMHHIVSDGWSMGVFVRELSGLYGAYSRGESDPLAPLQVQYADYAQWQRRWLTPQRLEEHRRYWQEQLRGAPALLELPTDHVRPAEQQYGGGVVPVVLDEELTAGLRELSRRSGTTLFMTLLAGWAVLLRRLSGQEDVVIGTPVANRGRAEIEEVIGFFVNTLALRLDLSGGPTVEEVLRRVKGCALAAQEHQELPFEQVVEWLNPVRSLAHTPVFQVMFAWQSAPEGGFELPGLRTTPVALPYTTAKFDMTLSLSPVEERIVGGIEYASALYERSTIERYGGYLHRVLRGMVQEGRQSIEAIDLLSEHERSQVLHQWNATDAPYPKDKCVHELFEEQVQRTPGAVAVMYEGQSLTYAQLNAQANQLAHYLRGLGVGPDARVALCLERSLEIVIAMLAVLKAGGAYVPLDPSYPPERLKYMLQDAAPKAVVTRATVMEGSHGAWLRQSGEHIRVIDLLAQERRSSRHPESNPEARDVGLLPRHVAVVIYTSGSSGQPKGVMIEHANLVNFLQVHIHNCALTASDRVLQFASVSFDASLDEIFPALTVGARVVLRPQELVAPDVEFERFVREQAVTVTDLPTAFWHQWIAEREGRTDKGSLRVVVVGGEKAKRHHLDNWRAATRSADGVWVNGYGPTETTVYSCTFRIADRDADLPAGEVPIGRPVWNTQIYILDGEGAPVPVGVTGEIYIGGAGVARGYLNRPELTAERFVKDPFSTVTGARMYRTGDLGRWRADGQIEYLGRNDFQVKVRGFRIELGEIESRLRQCPGVREAVVVAREDSAGDKRLVAYYTRASLDGMEAAQPQEDSGATPLRLRGHLAGVLPEYMVPAAYVRLDTLPLTTNGKLDRKALPVPATEAYAVRGYEEPQGEIERQVAQVWSEVLKVERVGRHANFFDLGGHSLLAVKVISRIRARVGWEVGISSLFAHAELAEFARAVSAGSGVDAKAQGLPRIVAAPRTGDLELSYAQQRLWFLAQIPGVSQAYHISWAVRLEGDLNRGALRSALDRIVQRHETLRTRFEVVDGQAVQRIESAPHGFALLEQDLGEVALREVIAAEAQGAFDLSRGPLIRGRLIRHSPHEHTVLITMHHIVSDGWSMGVFVRELSGLYGAYSRGESDPLAPLQVQYADYAQWQRRWLTPQRLEEHRRYWQEQLRGAPALLELPTDHVRPAEQQYGGGVVPVVLDEELTAGLRELSRRSGTTLFMTLLAGWAVLLRRLSGQEDVVIGTPVANRGRAEIEEVIGFFVNTLALRLDLSGGPTVEEVLRRVKGCALAAQEHQELPFEQVVEWLNPVRSLAHTPVFQVMFAWQSAPEGGFELPGLRTTPVALPYTTAKFDLTLSLSPVEERIVGGIEYASALYERSTIERYGGYLHRVLRGMVQEGRQSIEAIDLLSEHERSQVLHQWNATDAPYPKDKCVHELFEEQVQRTPGAVAVVYEGQSLTYAQLNAQANQLAHYLRAQGMREGEYVPILMPRCLRMLIAQLAVLKGGAAYVPVDPSLPGERQAFLIRDCGAQRVLAREPKSAACGLEAVQWIDSVEVAAALASFPPENLHLDLPKRAAAYVMYTSGSTGTPKGVIAPHRAVNRLVINNGYTRIEPTDCIAHYSNPAFDASTFEIWAALLNGARVLIVPREVVLEAKLFAALLREHSVTVLFQTTALFNQYALSHPEMFHNLRYLLFGGEASDPSRVRVGLREGRPGQLQHVYGPTETTTFATWYPVTAVEKDAKNLPIGRPIGNTRVYILDARQHPVPIGVTGELYIGGDGVALGYLNRPQLTAENFLKDPFSPDADARMYRTGDLGRWRADGAIEFLGRNDSQVKIRGFRIELEEIEAQLVRHPQVKEAVVLSREEVTGDKRLVAYYTSRGVTPEVASLREHLKLMLPDYMVPTAYVGLESLPLTSNGKLDRKALPAPDPYVTQEYEAPQGEIEAILARTWRELLRLERVGRQDNFFELGGHSLLAVSVVERLRREGLRTDVRTLFANPSLSGLAAAVGDGTVAEVPPNRIPAGCQRIEPQMLPLVSLTQEEIERIVSTVSGGAANVQDIYPLAPLQEGILFHHLLSTRGDPYVLSVMFGFDTRARLERYVEALQSVMDRHDILRTAVVWEGVREPIQVVWRQARVQVEEIALSGCGEAGRELLERCNPRQTRIDVRRAPMMRFFIARDAVARDGVGERWLLLWLHHHLLMDHMTLKVLQREIEAYLSGRGQELPPPLAFRHFVAQARLGVSAQEHERYFKQLLADVYEPTAPFGLLDVQAEGEGIREAHRGVPAPVGRRLREQARKLGVSAASVCHLAWAQVLARVSAREDVVFGTVLFGRMQGGEGAERVMGLLINALPVRIKVGEESVQSSVRGTHAQLTQLIRHEHASLALAQRCSGVVAPTPLFSALLNYRHSAQGPSGEPPGGTLEGGKALEGIEALHAQERTNYPLALAVDDFGESGFELRVQAQEPIDPQLVCDLMNAALERLVGALESAPGTASASVDVLPQSQREQVLVEWNATETPYPREKCIHELFEEQVERTPGAVAVVYEEERLTYAELNARANGLAHHLRGLGVGPDDLVGVCLERSLEQVVGILAVLKAGGAYVPLDPSYPPARLRYMLEDAAPKVVLSHAPVLQGAAGAWLRDLGGPAPLIDLSQHASQWGQGHPDRQSNPDRHSGLTPTHLAYVIYTSGSTGQPKGVMIEHRALVNHMVWQRTAFGFKATDTFLQRTSTSFDAAVWELWSAFCAGGRLCLLPSSAQKDPLAIAKAIRRYAVTIVVFTPSLLQAVLNVRDEGGQFCCRYIVCGGELLTGALLADARSSASEGLINLYGPTEATIDATAWSSGQTQTARHIPIGRPIWNTRVYILDRQGAPAPIGVAGEIHIAGAGLARGYLNQPTLTAERFVRDPFAAEPQARMYRTGDLGRWRADGNIEYLGRNDFQVKIRGFRVELEEIEAHLARHAAVKEAVVLAREDVPGDQRLVAYVVSRESSGMSAQELRAHLKPLLPEHMIPAAFVLLDRLPLTANGKLDRRALPPPGLEAYVGRQYEAPRGEVEEILAGIWQLLLRVQRVGRHDNFFELGGHSLLIVQMMEQLRRKGLPTEVRRVFECPTLADLAGTLTRGTQETDSHTVPPNLIPTGCKAITPTMLSLVSLESAHIERIVQAVPGGATNIQDIYPLTPLQEGILFHYALNERGADAYLTTMLLSSISLDHLESLIAALQQVIDRHDVLRTAVAWERLPRPVQVVHRRAILPVQALDLSPDRDALEQLQERMLSDKQRLDLRHAPLLRVQTAADPARRNWYALLQVHHLVCDAQSWGILIAEVLACLEGRVEHLPTPVPYRNHVGRTVARAEALDAQSFFHGKLGDVDEPTAPFGLLDTQGDGNQLEEARAELESALAQRVRLQARRLRVSTATLFHAAAGLVIGRTSGRNDVVFGTVLLGRLHGSADSQRTVGMFINTLPLRLQLRDATAKELVEGTQRELVDLLQHEHASLAVAQRCSGISGTAPLFTALLNYRHGAPDTGAAWSNTVGVTPLRTRGGTNYPLSLAVDDLGEGFVLGAQTVTKIDPRRMVAYFRGALQSLVDALEEAPQTPAQSLTVLPESERRQVLEAFMGPATGPEQEQTIHRLFEQQVERSPQARALVFEEFSLTYADLNRRANQLARYLCAKGVGRGQPVGICVERSLDLVLTILAVLKAGGAYLPLEPGHPPERLRYTLEDARLQWVLTQEQVRECLPDTGAEVIVLDSLWKMLAHESSANLRIDGLRSSDLAYVMYTSGSTGWPKGVMVEHRHVLDFWPGLEELYKQCLPCERVALNASITFDLSIQQILQLLSGRTLHILSTEVRRDPSRLLRVIEQQRIAAIDCTPSQLKSWLRAGLLDVAALRLVLVGGEAIDAALWVALSQCRHINFYNVYGPTECTIDATATLVNSDSTPPHIGRPMQGRRAYVLGPDRELLPVGVCGEIYLGGVAVARGYLNRPELTLERFLEDPFAGSPDARMYRTGDLGRWRSDGTLEYLGRNDTQVKIRGFRIELGEIEAQLLRHPQVGNAVVLASKDAFGEIRLTGYIVLTDESVGSPGAEELRSHLRRMLPEYMVPTAYLTLQCLPLTASGKLDRRALPVPEQPGVPGQSDEAPKGELEEALARIWQDLLQIGQVGRHDNFFDRGGHSLLATRVIAHVNQVFDVDLPLRVVFDQPTLKSMSEVIWREIADQVPMEQT